MKTLSLGKEKNKTTLVETKSVEGVLFDKAYELNGYLFKNIPVWQSKKPLVVGVLEELFDYVIDKKLPYSRRVVRTTIQKHCGSPSYLSEVLKGGKRYNLDGTTDGEVLDYELVYAKKQYKKVIAEIKQRKIRKRALANKRRKNMPIKKKMKIGVFGRRRKDSNK